MNYGIIHAHTRGPGTSICNTALCTLKKGTHSLSRTRSLEKVFSNSFCFNFVFFFFFLSKHCPRYFQSWQNITTYSICKRFSPLGFLEGFTHHGKNQIKNILKKMFFLKINTITSSLANDLIFGLALGFLKNNKSLMKKPYKYTDLAFNSDFKLQRQEREERKSESEAEQTE